MAVIFILVCSLLTAAYHPWAEEALNWYDMSTCFVLILIGLFGVVFLSLQNDIIFHKRMQLYDTADRLQGELEDYAAVLLFLIGVFGLEFLALVGWCIALLSPAKRNAVIRKEIDAK